MGAWGLGLFNSDHDLDIVADLSHEADCELYHPDDVEETRKKLDGGMLAQMTQKRWKDANDPSKCQDCFSRPDYNLVILGACAMTVGAVLPAELKTFMENNYRKVGLMRDALTQMEIGLKEYQDGTPFDFASKANTMTDDDLLYPDNGRGFKMLNVPSPGVPSFFNEIGRSYFLQLILLFILQLIVRWSSADSSSGRMAEQMRQGQQASGGHPANACGNCGKVPGEGGEALRRCTACKKQLYCNRGCQRAHWKKHKATCSGAA